MYSGNDLLGLLIKRKVQQCDRLVFFRVTGCELTFAGSFSVRTGCIKTQRRLDISEFHKKSRYTVITLLDAINLEIFSPFNL